MKHKLIISSLLMSAALVMVAGCSKEEAPAPPSAPEAPKATQSLPSDAAKAVDAVKDTANQAADQATTQVKAAQDQTQDQAQGLIDRAKSLVADQKYQDALASLGQLSNLKLTADQQKLVDDLKAKIQAALAKATATDPASALGGTLGGKK